MGASFMFGWVMGGGGGGSDLIRVQGSDRFGCHLD